MSAGGLFQLLAFGSQDIYLPANCHKNDVFQFNKLVLVVLKNAINKRLWYIDSIANCKQQSKNVDYIDYRYIKKYYKKLMPRYRQQLEKVLIFQAIVIRDLIDIIMKYVEKPKINHSCYNC